MTFYFSMQGIVLNERNRTHWPNASVGTSRGHIDLESEGHMTLPKPPTHASYLPQSPIYLSAPDQFQPPQLALNPICDPP